MKEIDKTKIEWTDYTWNPVIGCKHNCFYCYARLWAKRSGQSFEPSWRDAQYEKPYKIKEPSRIFVCSLADLFGDWIPDDWIYKVLKVVKDCPQHTFQFLTKNPKRMQKFSFPDNCWVGTTIESIDYIYRLKELQKANAKYHFISFEPLLGEINVDLSGEGIDQVIIGGITKIKGFETKKEWDKIKHNNKFYKSNFPINPNKQ